MTSVIDASPMYLTLPASQLPEVSKVCLEILPDLDALYCHFARGIADEIKANNQLVSPRA